MVARILKEKALVYALWISQSGNRKAYFILEVDKAKQKEFERLTEANEPFDISDYGKILYSGWEEPDGNLKHVFREKYGMYQD